MARPKPPLLKLREIEPGQMADCFALLAERAKGKTREGKPFYTCRFRDRRRTATLMVWCDAQWFGVCEKEWKEGVIYKIRVTYGEHEQYGQQIELHQLREVSAADREEGFNRSDVIDCSRFDPATMLTELRGLAETEISDAPFRRLVLTLLDRHAEALQRLPATSRHFYPFPGGLLEHLLSVTRTCLHLADKYLDHFPDLKPPLNRDLIVAGAILHDIGRVAEFDDDPLAPQQTVPGRLFGHLFLGRDLVRDAGREQGDVNPELLRLLEHVIISHLNLPEWGSPRLPLVPESVLIHHADDLDAKLEMYARCLDRDIEDGPFTARDPVLGRRLYKGRSV